MKDDYGQLVRNITIAGITIKEFANLIRVRPTSVINLKQPDRKVPKSMLIISTLMREMARSEVDFITVLEKESYTYKASPKKQ